MPLYRKFHLHGDNIVECERTIVLIRQCFDDIIQIFRGPFGSPVCPSYEIFLEGQGTPIELTLYPGFGRWNHDILDLVRRRGGTLREAADIIITGVEDSGEKPLLAIEYCGALPAGNQAWQRSGRAYSFGKAEIPYLYVAELAGFELDQNRRRKAARLPNPAVPFSYVSFSLTHETPTLPVFVTAPGADEAARTTFAEMFADEELLAMLRAVILGSEDDRAVEVLKRKALSFVEARAAADRTGRTLTPEQWEGAYAALSRGESLVDFLVEHTQLRWAKVAYIEALTASVRKLMQGAGELAIGLTSSNLPMCVLPRDNRPRFATLVDQLYEGRLDQIFLEWLRTDRHLTVCWVMGFKPRGDDARPDRGLPPLARMLIGPDADLMTVVYGPAPAAHWQRLHEAPRQLAVSNGLWEAILEVSDAILVDSSTDDVRRHGYGRTHWHEEGGAPELELMLVDPKPMRIGENDVDTVLHLVLAHHAGTSVFEGMCNPPGGDWSGLSLQTLDRAVELRWVSLRRVSGQATKRPDHVFQIFGLAGGPVILAVESKERASAVEERIGPRLARYVASLVQSVPSIERAIVGAPWAHSERRFRATDFRMASAIAFIDDQDDRVAAAVQRAEADIALCCAFGEGGQTCHLRVIPATPLGLEIATILTAIPLADSGISVAIQQLQ
jgi:hypothetical protein